MRRCCWLPYVQIFRPNGTEAILIRDGAVSLTVTQGDVVSEVGWAALGAFACEAE